MATDFDKLGAGHAANKTAALVTGRGVHWDPVRQAPEHHLASDTPLPIFPEPKSPTWVSLTGLRVNRLLVIGYAGKQNSSGNGANFVVRCDCGTYEHRSRKTLKSPEYVARAMCFRCDYLEQVKQGNVDLAMKGKQP